MGDFWENIWGENEEENEENEWHYNNKDSIIFLIDSSGPMFEVNDEGEIPFHNALKCVAATFTDKIISSETDLLGVVFYGTDKKNNLNDFDNIYVFIELDVPDAPKIVGLENLLKSDIPEFGHSEGEFPFCDALWTCSTMFSNCTTKVAHKRIFLFTNEDNPNSDNENLKKQSFQRAKDLAELGIDIELFSMNKPDNIFEPQKFYQHIISVGEDEDIGMFNFDAATKFEELQARVRRKEFKKRALGRIPLNIGKNISIGVSLYNLVSETRKGSYIWLDSKTNEKVKSVTKNICSETGTILMQNQIKYYYEYGGEKVIFEKNELSDIKTFDQPGLKLMGFKPKENLKIHHNIKHANFIYPDENTIKGSTVAFTSLLEEMIKRDKIAICRLTARQGSPPRFVALLPQNEICDEDGIQINAPGFHVIPLPYQDDIKPMSIVPEQTKKAKEEQIDLAKNIVRKLRINFDSQNFENPALQKHYASLQALALDRDVVEHTPDYVVPDEEGMLKFEDIILDWKNSIYPKDYVYVPKGTPVSGQKRKTPGSSDKPLLDLDTIDWKHAIESGQIKRITVPNLRNYLKTNNVEFASKCKKDELIEIIRKHVGAKAGPENPNPKKKNIQNFDFPDIKQDDSDEELVHKHKKVKREIHGDDTIDEGLLKARQESIIMNTDFNSDSDSDNDQTVKPMCKYGANCYRTTNIQHTAEYDHPKKDKIPVKKEPSIQLGQQKPICKYGKGCYRTGNADHLRDFDHPHLRKNQNIDTSSDSE